MSEGCVKCGRSEADRPMVFRGEDWCSEECRAALEEDGWTR